MSIKVMVIGLKKVLCGIFSLYIKKRFVVFKLKDVSMKHVFKDVLMAANITIGWVQRFPNNEENVGFGVVATALCF